MTRSTRTSFEAVNSTSSTTVPWIPSASASSVYRGFGLNRISIDDSPKAVAGAALGATGGGGGGATSRSNPPDATTAVGSARTVPRAEASPNPAGITAAVSRTLERLTAVVSNAPTRTAGSGALGTLGTADGGSRSSV